MKKSFLVGVLLAAAVCFLNCDLSGGKDDYYPTTVGSTWNYYFYVLATMPTTGAQDTVQTMNMETKATKNDKLSSGEDVTEMVTTVEVHIKFPDSTYTSVDTSYVRETGSAVLSYSSKDDQTPDTVLSLPLVKDKTWRISTDVTAKVVGQEDVTVTAGSYKNAWKVETVYGSGTGATTGYHWYANKVGMVKYHSEYSAGGYPVVVHGELTSANIK